MEVSLSHIQADLSVELKELKSGTLHQVSDFNEHNEAEFQLREGCYYAYQFSDESCSLEKSEVIEPSPFKNRKHEGRISPNTYVGTLTLPVYKGTAEIGKFDLEVRSVKANYRDEYRFMLESITEHAADLILGINSPVTQSFDIDYENDYKTLYQRYCFVKSIVESEDFDTAIQQIIRSPVSTWKTKQKQVDTRSLKRIKNADIKNLFHSSQRVSLPSNHSLRSHGINSLAVKIPSAIKHESLDTAENRFVKHALESFLFFCEDVKRKCKADSRLYKESATTIQKLESFLQHDIFKEVSRPDTLKLNSPVLQKKSGYREVLKSWLMFDLAAKLVWHGGEDVYQAGSKNVAKLYEYWLFFKLLTVVKEIFHIDSSEYLNLIKPTKDKLGLTLKEGNQIALNGIYNSRQRNLNIKFCYNRTFNQNDNRDKSGSWSLQMRPDYTLTLWPEELSEKQAEQTEQIVHIHFDAKYKVNLTNSKGEFENDEGTFKNEDVHKMHAYKDAIRRTGGAYVLYPGTKSNPTKYNGFHEILPGLGAFAIRPSSQDDGTIELKAFIEEVRSHFLNRATQRENISTKTYDIIKNNDPTVLNEPIPEYLDGSKLIPDETFIIVAYYKSKEQYDWIDKKRKYNFRTETAKGSLVLDSDTVQAKYILLYGKGDSFSNDLWVIKSKGPKVFTKEKLISMGYPNPRKNKATYLVYDIEKADLEQFGNASWNIKKLEGYKTGYQTGTPFTVSLTELTKPIKEA